MSSPPPPGRPRGTRFERERATYEAHKAELLPFEGQFVVIQGEEIAGVWATYEAASEAAYRRYGLGRFMIKQIFAVEPVHRVPSGVKLCPM